MLDVLQIILPILVGGSLGLIGGGGTVLAVPILIYAFSQDPKSAIGMSLGIVSIVSVMGSYSHWKKGNVKLENAAFFTPFAMLGAFLGAKLANLPAITGEFQMILFGSTVLISSILMIFKKSKEPTEEPFSEMEENKNIASHLKNKLIIEWKTVLFLAIQGLMVGILTGLVGVGGGFLIVPALVFVGKVPIREAIGTSLVIIFFNSMSGFLGYLGKVPMDWMIMGKFLLLAIIGVLIGVRFGEKVPRKMLQKIFGIFLFFMGVWLIYNQLTGS